MEFLQVGQVCKLAEFFAKLLTRLYKYSIYLHFFPSPQIFIFFSHLPVPPILKAQFSFFLPLNIIPPLPTSFIFTFSLQLFSLFPSPLHIPPLSHLQLQFSRHTSLLFFPLPQHLLLRHPHTIFLHFLTSASFSHFAASLSDLHFCSCTSLPPNHFYLSRVSLHHRYIS